ncbi:MFS transporter [Candidatus Woesearchaeota archaeon]|nr:MFS transporter [Candidatus Woesearchaeota archaeon]
MLNGYNQRFLHTKSSDMFQMYFLLMFRALGFSMIGIFLPLFLYVEKGYAFDQVVWFYTIMSLAFIVSCLMALKIVSKFGIKHSIILSYFILIPSFIMLFFIDSMNNYYWLIGFFQGLSFGLFWIAFHVDAALHIKRKSSGKASGLISFSSVIGAVIGPIFGAFVIYFWGFNLLFIIALCLFIVSFLPLFLSNDVYIKTDFHFKQMFNREHYKYFFGYFAQGVRYTVSGIFWPIFAFLILQSYVSLGFLTTLGTLIVGIFGYYIGKKSDHFRKGKLIKMFAMINGVFSVVRIFAWSVLSVFGFGLAEHITSAGVDVPLLAKTYSRAKREEIAGFVFFREFMLRMGELFALIIVLFIGLKWSLVLGGFSNLLFLLF